LFYEIDQSKYSNFIGSDEVGRGCLAGPVVCCSALTQNISSTLSKLYSIGVKDSKKLTKAKRRNIVLSLDIDLNKIYKRKNFKVTDQNTFTVFNGKYGIRLSIAVISPRAIERINILNASLLGMKLSGQNLLRYCLNEENTLWMFDGNKLPKILFQKRKISTESLIKGDSRSILIGLASIIAKEFRDKLMRDYSEDYSHYGLSSNMGYPTKVHRDAIKKYGPSKLHRNTFSL
tara:strand:+ start:247 stop:942 length:696 start_codon:yes stop_codon:yes gene_type:complete